MYVDHKALEVANRQIFKDCLILEQMIVHYIHFFVWMNYHYLCILLEEFYQKLRISW